MQKKNGLSRISYLGRALRPSQARPLFSSPYSSQNPIYCTERQILKASHRMPSTWAAQFCFILCFFQLISPFLSYFFLLFSHSKFNFIFPFLVNSKFLKNLRIYLFFVQVLDNFCKFLINFCFKKCSELYFFSFLIFLEINKMFPFFKNVFIFHNYSWFPIFLSEFEKMF